MKRWVLRDIGQLATCPADAAAGDAGLIDDAALAVEDGRVAWTGAETALPDDWVHAESVTAGGALVTPGLIDAHTHLAFGGWRADEFRQRLEGRSYADIAAAGGGILSTVRATRAAETEALRERARTALDGMLALGVTTVEAKSGYGLDHHHELRILGVYAQLQDEHPVDLVPTYLGAHVVPPEHHADPDAYVAEMCSRTLPEIADLGLAEFCDAFVERGAFTVAQARRLFTRARELGLGIKLHADQLSDSGGAALAAEFGAVSAEHLEYTGGDGRAALAAAGTVAVSLPLASLYLGEPFLDGRAWREAGCRVAVATDFNPGSAPSWDLHLALLLACTRQGMTPAEALIGATASAAQALGRGGEVGSLVPGARADVALFDGPTLDHWLYHFRPGTCRAVYKDGVRVHSR